MSYREEQRVKAVQLIDSLIRGTVGGLFKGREYNFVLKDAYLNLWDGIREDAIDYFERNNITWWMPEENGPTGHLLSSQIACLNHLYWLRQRNDIVTAILKGIDPSIIKAKPIDDGFVEFEVIGKENYLHEKSHTRGANSTSVDALMVGCKQNNQRTLFFIEWKYTEFYQPESKYIPERFNIYNPLLDEKECPISIENYEHLYFEPFYQLMRQTLLAWQMAKHWEYGADDYMHIHVIPEKNIELRNKITSPGLKGNSMSDAWKNVLTYPGKYVVVTPEKLLGSVINLKDTKTIINYLRVRYWD